MQSWIWCNTRRIRNSLSWRFSTKTSWCKELSSFQWAQTFLKKKTLSAKIMSTTNTSSTRRKVRIRKQNYACLVSIRRRKLGWTTPLNRLTKMPLSKRRKGLTSFYPKMNSMKKIHPSLPSFRISLNPMKVKMLTRKTTKKHKNSTKESKRKGTTSKLFNWSK